MSELDLDALKRMEGTWRSQGEGPLVTRACWNQIRRQLPAIIAALERGRECEAAASLMSGHLEALGDWAERVEEVAQRVRVEREPMFGHIAIIGLDDLRAALESKP